MGFWLRRIVGAAAAAGLVVGSLTVPVSAAAGPHSVPSGAVINPYSPAYGHPYRHGVVPTVGQYRQMKAYEQSHPAPATTRSTGPKTLAYGGGIDGIGVTSATPKIYLVFWGSQWGTQSTDSNGNLTFSHDTAGGAPYLQNLFKGLGTANELWSGTMTQYCDGPSVAAGATSCPTGAPHVGYPTGGALAGVWYDNSAAEPSAASGHQIGQEAVNAAAHFGNTTAASNRYAQYVILSPTGLNPDNYQTSGFCAWHDYNGDTTLGGGAVNSPYGDVAFTNMPYVMDAGTNCGQGFVNSPGTLDGYSIVSGHEYAETVTDQNPAGGWTNQQANTYGGQENGDECAWISSGQGASSNVTMGTGSFAMQSTWSNDTNRCDISHAIVGGISGPDFSIGASPGSLSITQGGSGTSTISTAVASGSAGTVNLSASVSPSGPTTSLSVASVTAGGSATLTVNIGSSVATGSYTVTVTGTEGSATHSTTVSVIVPSVGITNGGFETGGLSGWTASGTASTSTTAHSGTHSAMVGSNSATNGDSSMSQTFIAPSAGGSLTFWYQIHCPDTLTYDWATASLTDNTAGTTSTLLAKTCSNAGAWVQSTGASVTGNHSYTLTLTSHDDNYPGDPTYTLYDDVALTANGPPDFSISGSPSSLSVAQGASGSSTISTTAIGSPGTVSLTAGVVPAGPTVGPSSTSVAAGGSSTLTVTAGSGVGPGTYTVTVTGTEGSASHATTVTVTVTSPPDFTIAANPSSLTVAQGSSVTSTISTTVVGPPGTVSLSAAVSPAGPTAGLSPTSLAAGSSSTLTVSAGCGVAPGTYTVTVSGTEGSASHATTVNVTVTPTTPDFTLGANPTSLTIAQGGSRTSTISTTAVGCGGTVSLNAGGSPSGPTVSLSPASVSAGGTSTLTVSAGSAVSTGSYVVTVAGTEGSASHSTTVTVTVTSGGTIVNGGFETGSLSGWTTSGATGISSASHSGSYAAFVGSTSPTNGNSSIAQTFTVSTGMTQLSFWYQVHCPDTVTYDWATATLRDNTAGSTATVLSRTCTNNGTWVKVTAGVVAGHSYTLTLMSRDDNYPGDPTYTLYDDVVLQ